MNRGTLVLEGFCMLLCNSTFCHPVTRSPLTCLMSLYISLHFLEFCVNGITQCALFFVWLLLLSLIRWVSAILLHVLMISAFSWLGCIPLGGQTIVPLSTYLIMGIWAPIGGYYKQSISQSGCPILHFHQQCWVPVPPYPRQHLEWSVFPILFCCVAVSPSTVVLLCISLMTNDVEHLFMHLFAIRTVTG